MRIASTYHLKEWLNMSGEDNDAFLGRLADAVSERVRQYTGRRLTNASYTDDLNGTGLPDLALDNFPVYDNGSNFSVYIDPDRAFAASSLLTRTGYFVDAGAGVIELLPGADYSVFPRGRRNIRVVYAAGLSTFKVVSGGSDRLSVAIAGAGVGAATTLSLTPGDYDAADLAAHIQALMTANGTYAADNFGISYNQVEQRFRLYADSVFTAAWGSGADSYRQAAQLLGFNGLTSQVAEAAAGGGYELYSDVPVNGLPADILLACQKIVHHWYDESKRGANLEMHAEKDAGEFSITYVRKGLPKDAQEILDTYTGLIGAY